ncbi:Mov34/MPN/PAD-1 family protein [Magnetococcales bacterium HHB-1]
MWTLARPVINKIFTHAQRAAPKECVGLLSGEGKQIQGWHPLDNVEGDSKKKFLADPGAQVTLFRTLREKGTPVRAIYHSHPEGPALPSKADLKQIAYPDMLYIIVSLAIDGRMDLNAFVFDDGALKPEAFEIID